MMLINKGWCSVTGTLTPCWVPDLPHRRGNGNGNGVVSCSSAPHPVTLSSQDQSGAISSSPVAGRRLQLGSLTDNDLSYTESFAIRVYEVGINETATIQTIANMLQEVSTNHGLNMGSCSALLTAMRKLNLTCVIARMHIEMYKYPAWRDVVDIETWFTDEGRIGIRRDFIIKDSATGLVYGRATSKWVFMNQDTRRFGKITPEIMEFKKFVARKSRLAFPDEKNKKILWKIPVLEDPAQYCRPGLVPRRADLDMNQHVNNVTHIGWALESIPQEAIDTHELRSIAMDYRRECHHADLVDSLATQESWDDGTAAVNGTNDSHTTSHQHHSHSRQFLHLLRLSGNSVEISRGRSEWRRKKNKP